MNRRLGRASLVVSLLAMIAVASHVSADPMGERMAVALVLDTSGSLNQADADRRTALALQITLALPPGSEVAVFSFDDEPHVLQERTGDPAKVVAAVGRLERAGRFTALHDAVFDASRYLGAGEVARRAIVLITDGKDENSALTFEDAVKAARENQVPVYTVGVGRVQERVLRRLAELTRGEYLGRRPKAEVAARRVAAAPMPKVMAEFSAPPPPRDIATPLPGTGSPVASVPPSRPAPAAGERVASWSGAGLALLAAAAVLGVVAVVVVLARRI